MFSFSSNWYSAHGRLGLYSEIFQSSDFLMQQELQMRKLPWTDERNLQPNKESNMQSLIAT